MKFKSSLLKAAAAIAILLFVVASSYSQKQGNIWYFGYQAGLDFNSGSAVVITDGKVNTDEGVATICNKHGELIMYTDGITVWDKSHSVMPNGTALKGDPSATQSGVVVPQPVRGNRYYIFTVGDDGGQLNYSVVDTNANFKYGDVIPSEKNKLLLSASCEKVTAVLHANKVDIWIIAHEWGNDKFVAYLLRSSGLVTTPVVTQIGVPVGPSTSKSNVGYSKGQLKLSPDGTKLANPVVGSQSTNNDGFWEFYDFDNATGKLSNLLLFTNSNKPSGIAGYDGLYGSEFSPNGKYLYLGCRRTAGGSNDRIYQFDIKAGNRTFADINATGVEIAGSSGGSINNSYGALQVAPDEKIYVARYNPNGNSFMSIIEKPNCKGSACKFISNGITLSGKRSRWGLPTFISSYFNKPEFDFGDPDPNNYGLCIGDSTQFWVLDTAGVDSVQWIFGELSSGAANYANSFSPKHKYSKDSLFLVQAVIFRKNSFSSCLLDTVSRYLTIFPRPTIDLGRDTTLCQGESKFINAIQSNVSYEWYDKSTNPNITITKSDTVWLKLKLGGCFASDTVIIKVVQFPVLNLGKDTVMCNIDSLLLKPGKAETYLWKNSTTDSVLKVKTAGTYWVEGWNYRCISYDTIVIGTSKVPVFDLGRDTAFCIGDSITVKVVLNGAQLTYVWNNSKTDSFLTIKTAGTYWVRASDSLCKYTDTIKIGFNAPKTLELGPDRKMCNGDTVKISATIAGVTKYTWHDNSIDSTFKASKAGKVWVDVFDGFCNLTDSLNVTVLYPTSVNLGPDTTLCDGVLYRPLDFIMPGFSYKWNGSAIENDTTITKTGIYWLDVRDEPDQKCLATDTVKVTFQFPKKFNLGKDTVLCIGQIVNLDASAVGAVKSSVWQDAVTGLKRANNPAQVMHWLKIDDGICTSVDTINISYKPALTISLGADQQLCDNATLTKDITNVNAISYEWKDNIGTQLAFTPTYTINNPGGDIIGVISDGLCSKSDTFKVSYFNTPIVDLGLDDILCDNDVVDFDFSALDADVISWSDGSSSPIFQITKAGTYWMRASKGTCMDQDSIIIGYTTAPVIKFPFRDTSLCEPTNFNFDFTLPHTTYFWDDGSASPKNKINSKGKHWVIATNVCGTDSSSFNIEIDEFGCFVIFPTAFSPNGNLVNDVFRPIGNVLEFLEMNIYNRWGEKIFEGPAQAGWDGTVKGAPAPQGVYYYNVTYRKISGGYPRRYTEHGTVHLVR